MCADALSVSAFNQQRGKLKPEAPEAVFNHFNASVQSGEKTSGYRFFAADGSTFIFFSKPKFAPGEYHVCQGHSAKGFYSMHLNAFYDLQKHTYSDALIQPVRQKDEFDAFCTMVDRYPSLSGVNDVFIGDRGYCSYNNMAHVLEKGQYFLFRTKDIHSKGLVGNFDFLEEDSFDIRVNVTLVRSHKRKIAVKKEFYRRYVDVNATFDYLAYALRIPMIYPFGLSGFPYQKIPVNVLSQICREMNSLRRR